MATILWILPYAIHNYVEIMQGDLHNGVYRIGGKKPTWQTTKSNSRNLTLYLGECCVRGKTATILSILPYATCTVSWTVAFLRTLASKNLSSHGTFFAPHGTPAFCPLSASIDVGPARIRHSKSRCISVSVPFFARIPSRVSWPGPIPSPVGRPARVSRQPRWWQAERCHLFSSP